jgi:nucleoside-diphosphate-sugar epimerase
MAGRKFGTCGEEALTWAMNVIAPENTANRFKDSKTVVFSTGCVYPLVTAESGGCDETVTPVPVGEYAQSCLGRERVFEFHAKTRGLKVLLLRLNYAIDPRYGVLHDIASNVMAGHPVSLSAPCFNCLWQRDANDWALRSLELCASPAAVLNITGPETLPVKETAEKFAEFFGKKALFSAEPGGRCYLSSAAKAVKLFGYPGAGPADMLESQAEWLLRGGRSLGKPTHFETTNGKF